MTARGFYFIFFMSFIMWQPPVWADAPTVYSVNQKAGRSFVRFVWTLSDGLLFPEDDEAVCSGLVLEGKIRRGGEVLDAFRLEFTPSQTGEAVHLAFDRVLPRGDFQLHAELLDCAMTAVIARDLNFSVAGREAPEQELPLVTPLQTHAVRILPMDRELQVRKVLVEAAVSGKEISAVRFLLDGKDIGQVDKAPYQKKIKLPRGPRMMDLEVEALNESGHVLARDGVVLNEGPYAFSVRIATPMDGGQYQSGVRAEALVTLPEEENLKSLKFFLNDQLITTLRESPYTTPVALPKGQGPFDLRVEGLTDRDSKASDSVLFNAPGVVAALEVRQVELWASVYTRNNQPVLDLSPEDFQIYEDGKRKDIEHFSLARDLPLHLTFLTDISGSMMSAVPEIAEGTRRMINANIGEKDRASLMLFLDKPKLLTPFTNDRRLLNEGLDQLLRTPRNPTLGSGIYDSMAYALHRLGGIHGRRALLVFTDGVDNRSEYDPREFARFAKQAQIRVYVIAARNPQRMDRLELLSAETGGGYYVAGSPGRLLEVLEIIDGELRSQYRITYQSQSVKRGEDCRKIKIKLKPKKLRVNAMKFYCP